MKKRGISVESIGIILIAMLLNSCAGQVQDNSQGEISTVYGKLVDQNNKPIPGEVVLAEWTVNGKLHTTQTVTLTKEDATGLGDPGLEGLFLFSKGEIDAPRGTEITLKTLPRFTSMRVKASPGNTVDAGRMMLLRSTSPPLTPEEKSRESVEVIGSDREDSGKTRNAPHAEWWMAAAYALLLSGMLLFFFYRKWRKRKKAVEEFVFRKDMDSLELMRVEEVMSKDVITTTPDVSIQEALELIMHHHINSVVVADGKKVRGILTETDFLRKVHGAIDLTQIKVREVMHSPILTVPSTTPVLAVLKLMLKRGIRKIPVVKNGELAGIVSFTDMLKLFHNFFVHHPEEVQSPLLPTAGHCCTKEMTVVNKQDPLSSVTQLMRERNVSYVLVSAAEQASAHNILKVEEDMGIITTKDLLDELYKNPHGFEMLKAINVMRTPLLSIEHSKTVAEAILIMEENAIRRLPVKSHAKLVGMLTQPPLLGAVVDYFEKAKGRGKRK
jgi:CBS domain-containing protein